MAGSEAALEADKVVLLLVVLARMVGHDVLAQCPAECQLLLKAILQEISRPGRILLAQIVDVYYEATRLLCHHRPDVGRVDALVLLRVGTSELRFHSTLINSPHRRESPSILSVCPA